MELRTLEVGEVERAASSLPAGRQCGWQHMEARDVEPVAADHHSIRVARKRELRRPLQYNGKPDEQCDRPFIREREHNLLLRGRGPGAQGV